LADCPQESADKFATLLEQQGFHKTGTAAYQISVFTNLKFESRIAYRYENDHGEIRYAACDGIRDPGAPSGESIVWGRLTPNAFPTQEGYLSLTVKDFEIGGYFGEDFLKIQIKNGGWCTREPMDNFTLKPILRCHSKQSDPKTIITLRRDGSGTWSDISPDGRGGSVSCLSLTFNEKRTVSGLTVLIGDSDPQRRPQTFYVPAPPPKGANVIRLIDAPNGAGLASIPDSLTFKDKREDVYVMNESGSNVYFRLGANRFRLEANDTSLHFPIYAIGRPVAPNKINFNYGWGLKSTLLVPIVQAPLFLSKTRPDKVTK